MKMDGRGREKRDRRELKRMGGWKWKERDGKEASGVRK